MENFEWGIGGIMFGCFIQLVMIIIELCLTFIYKQKYKDQ